MQKSCCFAKKLIALDRPDATDINNIGVVQVRLDVLVVVGIILDDARQYQLVVANPGNFKCLSGAIVIVNAPKKEQIIVRLRLKIKLVYINTVMYCLNVVKIRRPIGSFKRWLPAGPPKKPYSCCTQTMSV